MLFQTASVVALLSSLASAAPLEARAGGPAIVKIPAGCSVNCAAPTYPTDSFKPSAAFQSAHGVFSNYIPNDSVRNVSDTYNTCLEQCFGFGNPGQCVSTVFAHNVTYQAYGVTNVGYACLMFGAPLTSADLVSTTDGSYAGARGTNIGCKRSQ